MKSRKKSNHVRQSRVERRQTKRSLEKSSYSPDNIEPVQYDKIKPVKPLQAKTAAQSHYLKSIENNIITFGIGPAGTGKTFCSAAYAAQLIQDGKIDSIIVTRPGVEAGESFGFLPGEIEEKYAPYLEPFMSVLNERLGKSTVAYMIKHKKIIASPLSFMRGVTFKDSFVILDEAQNVTTHQMKMFLTRIGENCKMVIDGDTAQSDIRDSGLQDAVARLSSIPSIGVVRFTVDDIVRHGIIKDIIRAYDK